MTSHETGTADRVNPAPRIKRVVSVCEARDIMVWTVASVRIIRFIAAGSYRVICPDSQIESFITASAPGWEVVGEGSLGGDACLRLIQKMAQGENLKRVNWLYQQFLKINAIRDSDLANDDVTLIWDADTVPLRRLDFLLEGTERLACYHGKEHHKPYFDTIRQLLGYERCAGFSFIAQCLPMRAGWLREMLDEIEGRFGVPYEEAVLGLLPGQSGSEFSEYETLGSWIWQNHGNQMVLKQDNHWLRSGSRWFGADPRNLKSRILFRLLALHYHYVAIEKWCRPVTLERVARYAARLVRREREC